jgi:hypothetical protein
MYMELSRLDVWADDPLLHEEERGSYLRAWSALK